MLVPKAGGDTLAPFPANQLEFVPKITDFGLAKLEKDAYETCSTGLVGTPVYMAPEQAEPSLGEVSRQTDVYALGVILYEMMVGQPPFSGTSDVETLRRVALDEPAPPRRLRRRLPRDLEAICLKCLEKTPAARYATAAALADDLTRFLTKQPTQARPLGPMHRSLKWVRRRPAVAALLAIIVLTGMAELANYWWQAATLREALAVNRWIRRQAEDERRAARDQARRVRSFHYVADMTSALDAWRMARVSQAVELLAAIARNPAKKIGAASSGITSGGCATTVKLRFGDMRTRSIRFRFPATVNDWRPPVPTGRLACGTWSRDNRSPPSAGIRATSTWPSSRPTGGSGHRRRRSHSPALERLSSSLAFYPERGTRERCTPWCFRPTGRLWPAGVRTGQ